MKRKIIVILSIIILLALSSYGGAKSNIPKVCDDPDPQAEYIDYFDWGIITGTYETKKYNEKDHLILKNEDYNSKTIKITGVGWTYDYGEIPWKTIGSVKASWVEIWEFFGYCNNGRVFGIGYKEIHYSPLH